MQALRHFFRDLIDAWVAVAEQNNRGYRNMAELHPGSHRGAAQRYLSTVKSPVGQKPSNSRLSLEADADGSLQRLSSRGPSPRCRSSAVGSLPGTRVEKPSHVAGRWEEVTELFIVTGGAECR